MEKGPLTDEELDAMRRSLAGPCKQPSTYAEACELQERREVAYGKAEARQRYTSPTSGRPLWYLCDKCVGYLMSTGKGVFLLFGEATTKCECCSNPSEFVFERHLPAVQFNGENNFGGATGAVYNSRNGLLTIKPGATARLPGGREIHNGTNREMHVLEQPVPKANRAYAPIFAMPAYGDTDDPACIVEQSPTLVRLRDVQLPKQELEALPVHPLINEVRTARARIENVLCASCAKDVGLFDRDKTPMLTKPCERCGRFHDVSVFLFIACCSGEADGRHSEDCVSNNERLSDERKRAQAHHAALPALAIFSTDPRVIEAVCRAHDIKPENFGIELQSTRLAWIDQAWSLGAEGKEPEATWRREALARARECMLFIGVLGKKAEKGELLAGANKDVVRGVYIAKSETRLFKFRDGEADVVAADDGWKPKYDYHTGEIRGPIRSRNHGVNPENVPALTTDSSNSLSIGATKESVGTLRKSSSASLALRNGRESADVEIPTHKLVATVTSSVNTRTGPGTSYPLVPNNNAWVGATVRVLDWHAAPPDATAPMGWAQIVTPDGSTGFASKQYLRLQPPGNL